MPIETEPNRFKSSFIFISHCALLMHLSAGAAPAPAVASSCQLDAGSAIHAASTLGHDVSVALLDSASSSAILGKQTIDSSQLQAEENSPAAGATDTRPARVQQGKGAIRITVESGRQWCFTDFSVDHLPSLEGDAEQFSFRGRFGNTAYLRVDRFVAHDAPSASLIEPRSGKRMDFDSNRDAAVMAPDGKRFLLAHDHFQAPGFAVAAPADDGPRIDLACSMPELHDGDPRKLAAEIKGWEGNEAFALMLRPESKKSAQSPIALRLRRENGNWLLAASDPEAVRKAGGFRCRENITLPATGASCSTGCDKVAVRSIAPGLDLFQPLQTMFTLAMQNGGEGHEKEIGQARQAIEAYCKECKIREHVNRKQARRLNESGMANLRAGKLAEAAEQFRQASDADPVDVEILNNLGYAEMLTGHPDASLHLVSALIIEPSRANAWANLGDLFARKDAVAEAVACFSLSLRFAAQPAKTLQFLKNLALKDNTPGLTEAVQRLGRQPWVAQIANAAESAPIGKAVDAR